MRRRPASRIRRPTRRASRPSRIRRRRSRRRVAQLASLRRRVRVREAARSPFPTSVRFAALRGGGAKSSPPYATAGQLPPAGGRRSLVARGCPPGHGRLGKSSAAGRPSPAGNRRNGASRNIAARPPDASPALEPPDRSMVLRIRPSHRSRRRGDDDRILRRPRRAFVRRCAGIVPGHALSLRRR